MSSPETQKSVVPIFIGAVIMIAVFAGLVLAIRSTVPQEGSLEEVERAEARRENLRVLLETNEQELTQYGWVDKEAGTVRIPIQRAMELELVALNQSAPKPAYPIQQVPAVPATATTPDTAPAPATEAAPAAPAAPAAGPEGAAPAADAAPAAGGVVPVGDGDRVDPVDLGESVEEVRP